MNRKGDPKRDPALLIWMGPRRDMCYFVGRRAARLSLFQSAIAWQDLAAKLEAMGDKDVPRFSDLITSIRAATVKAKARVKATQ